MMYHKVWYGIMLGMLCTVSYLCANEFIKTKPKKEVAAKVKEDIAELLESAVRQLGRNIQQTVIVENKIFDTMKELLEGGQRSTAQLKELRTTLEKYLKKFEEQQLELQNFLLACV